MSARPVLCPIEHRCSSELYRRGDTVGGGGQLSELAGEAFQSVSLERKLDAYPLKELVMEKNPCSWDSPTVISTFPGNRHLTCS